VKNYLVFACILVFAFFVSCAGRPAVVETAPPRTEKAPETAIEAPTVPVTETPALSAFERAIQKVKQNLPDVRKYYALENNGKITVKGELQEDTDSFDVIYDLNFASGFQADSGYTVPFTIKSDKTGMAANDVFLWKPRKDSAGILLTFDDNYEEAWKKHFDLLDNYNAKVTFFIQGEYSSFCQAALERGHDIGYHTKNHLNLKNVSKEVFTRETLSAVESFRKAGVPLNSFAYPYGFFDPWMHEELLKHYSVLRGYGVTFRLYDKTQIEGFINSKALDNVLFVKDEDFTAEVDTMLRVVKFIGGDLVLPLTTHDISSRAAWGIKPERLEYLLQTANDLQLVFYTYRDLAGQ